MDIVMSYFHNDTIQRASGKGTEREEDMTDDLTDAVLGFWDKYVELSEGEDVGSVDSTTLSILQDIAFWNKQYTNPFTASSDKLPHLHSMDAALQAGQGLGMINEALQSMNKDLPPEAAHAIESEEELINEKIASGSAILVIAALRLAQENGFLLSKAVEEEIKVQTGIDMTQAVRSYIIDAMKQLQAGKEENETDNE